MTPAKLPAEFKPVSDVRPLKEEFCWECEEIQEEIENEE